MILHLEPQITEVDVCNVLKAWKKILLRREFYIIVHKEKEILEDETVAKVNFDE
jgi:hypothetical protein